MQRMNLDSIPHTTYKVNSTWSIDLNVRTTVLQLLEENVGVNFYHLGLGNNFLDVTSKAQANKL